MNAHISGSDAAALQVSSTRRESASADSRLANKRLRHATMTGRGAGLRFCAAVHKAVSVSD